MKYQIHLVSNPHIKGKKMRIKLSLVTCMVLEEMKIQKIRSRDFKGDTMVLKGKRHGI